MTLPTRPRRVPFCWETRHRLAGAARDGPVEPCRAQAPATQRALRLLAQACGWLGLDGAEKTKQTRAFAWPPLSLWLEELGAPLLGWAKLRGQGDSAAAAAQRWVATHGRRGRCKGVMGLRQET
jgi:hypothetical protein